MAIDPSIIFQAYKPQTAFDPIGAMQAGQQYRSNQMVMQQNQAKMDEARRKQQEQIDLDEAISSNLNPDGTINQMGVAQTLAAKRRGGSIMGFQGKQLEMDTERAKALTERAQGKKFAAEERKSQIESMKNSVDFIGMVAGGTYDAAQKGDLQGANMGWQYGLKKAQEMGMDVTGIPQTFDPDFAFNLKRMTLKESDRLSAELRRQEAEATDKRHSETIATTRRGQDLVSARAGEANRVAAQGNVIKGETDLRKEFADLPEVKSYKMAYPSFAAIQKASQGTTPQSDINLIYGIAKLYDPNSVVREGEYNTIANSQAIPEAIKGMAQRLMNGGRLTAETKAQLMAEAQSRIGIYEGEYRKAQDAYSGIARQRGLSPESVFTPIGDVGQRGEKKAQPTFTMAQVRARAKATGESEMSIINAIKAKGGKVQ